MTKLPHLIIADYTQDSMLSITELCEICGVTVTGIDEYVAYDILQPAGSVPNEWLFDLTQLARMQKTLRLQRDFHLDLTAAALVLDLLDEVDELHERLAILEKHTLK
jgi:chaperone modulatory protein CbpM